MARIIIPSVVNSLKSMKKNMGARITEAAVSIIPPVIHSSLSSMSLLDMASQPETENAHARAMKNHNSNLISPDPLKKYFQTCGYCLDISPERQGYFIVGRESASGAFRWSTIFEITAPLNTSIRIRVNE